MNEFDKQYPRARSNERKDHWPANVRSISIEGTEFIGVDDAGQLYWDGKQIATKSELRLDFWQSLAVLLGVAAAITVAAVEALRFLGYGWDKP